MKKFTFIWSIENFSYCWHNKGETLDSPTFYADILQKTTWKVRLYPRGDRNPNFIGIYLCRSKDCEGPEKVKLNYDMSFYNSNGAVICSLGESKNKFKKDFGFGRSCFLKRYVINVTPLDKVLDSDVLKVCCSMWIGEGQVEKEDMFSARTRVGLEKISFINVIEHFNDIQGNQEQSINVSSLSKNGRHLSGYLHFKNGQGSEETAVLKVFSDSENVHLISCNIYLLNSVGGKVECGKMDTRNEVNRKRTFNVPIDFGMNYLLGKPNEHVPNDGLTIRCEYTLSTGIQFQKIVETHYDIHLTPCLKERLHGPVVTSLSVEQGSALDDFRSMYMDNIFSDIQLKTLSKTFNSHKNVLSASSPVFRAMLTTNMKEKIMDCIEVHDLDDITVDQLLIFLYTDNVENLQWESAMKLYYAADKYQVQRLKVTCSSFLIANLDPSNIIEVLTLADRHEDSYLKATVENFICQNCNELFDTEEWESFMDVNPQLAMKTMHCLLKNKLPRFGKHNDNKY